MRDSFASGATRGQKGRGRFARPGLKKKRDGFIRKKVCRFCTERVRAIDYKDIKRLESFVTERGKVLSRRYSGNCAKHQRRLVDAIKKARFIALLPYTR